MGCLGFLCRSSAFVFAVIAIFVGVLISGVPGPQRGILQRIDNYVDANGNSRFKGLTPFLHEGVPYGFDVKDVPAGSLKGQTFVVTGANVGLGYWTAYHLASKGGHTIMACRSVTKCETAKKEILKLLEGKKDLGTLECSGLDLGSLSSVRDFATSFTSTHKKLNSLILNAGVMMCPHTLTVDGIEKQIGTNHFGHFYLTQLLLDTLASTATPSVPATVCVVSSSAHYDTYPEGVHLSLFKLNEEKTYNPVKAYGQSKLANVLFAQELSERVKDKNILVNVIHPGLVATDLGRHIRDALSPYLPEIVIQSIYDLLQNTLMWHAKVASYTQVYAAIGKDILEYKVTGKYFHPIAREARPHAVHAFNNTLQKGLWKLTEQVLKEKVTKLK